MLGGELVLVEVLVGGVRELAAACVGGVRRSIQDALPVCTYYSCGVVPVPVAPDEFLGRAVRAADLWPGPGSLDCIID